MYTRHFGLLLPPFQESLDPYWFVEGPAQEEAVARLLYLVEGCRRCGALVGPAGSGKSLLLAAVEAHVRRLPRQTLRVDLLGKSGRELLWETASGLGLGPQSDATPRNLWRMLEDRLAGCRQFDTPLVLCLDDVDRSASDCLAVVERLQKLLVEGGCPATLLLGLRSAKSPVWQASLSQLVDLAVELPPLDEAATGHYIAERLALAGAVRPLFDTGALRQIHLETEGLPRAINRLCELSLIAGMAVQVDLVTASIVSQVSTAETLRRSPGEPSFRHAA
ncbi:MAG: ExeA family protein [Planctomycetales bacterium]